MCIFELFSMQTTQMHIFIHPQTQVVKTKYFINQVQIEMNVINLCCPVLIVFLWTSKNQSLLHSC